MRWLVLVTLAVAGGAAGAPVPPPGPPPAPRPLRKIWVPAWLSGARTDRWHYIFYEDVPGVREAGRQYNGTVTAVSRAGVTLADPETFYMDEADLKAMYDKVVLEKGEGWTRSEYRAKKPIQPRRFEASPYQAAGVSPVFPKRPKQPKPPAGPPNLLHQEYGHTTIVEYYYLLEDVQVGDKVAILFSRRGDKDVVDGVSILRRPGGHIPYPRVNEDEFPARMIETAMELADAMNEHQAQEEEAAKAKAAEPGPKK